MTKLCSMSHTVLYVQPNRRNATTEVQQEIVNYVKAQDANVIVLCHAKWDILWEDLCKTARITIRVDDLQVVMDQLDVITNERLEATYQLRKGKTLDSDGFYLLPQYDPQEFTLPKMLVIMVGHLQSIHFNSRYVGCFVRAGRANMSYLWIENEETQKYRHIRMFNFLRPHTVVVGLCIVVHCGAPLSGMLA